MTWTSLKNTGVLLLAWLITAASAAAAAPVTEIHYVMGTYYSITTDDLAEPQARALMRRCFSEARRLETVFSRYEATSELSRLNAHNDGGPIQVSADLADLLARSLRLQVATGGRFDVTIGALTPVRGTAKIEATDLRGSPHLRKAVDSLPNGPSRRRQNTAAPQGERKESSKINDNTVRAEDAPLLRGRLEALLAHLPTVVRGQKRTRLVADRRVVLSPGVQLDFDGIAKGYTVDRCVAVLRKAGVRRALLSLGESSQYALGAPLGATAWPVTVRDLDGARAVGTLALRDQALSVSSAFTPEKHVAHIIDPRSGKPIREPSISVVVMQSATDAEAWSKALLIDGGSLRIDPSDSPAALRITRRGIERRGGIAFTAYESPRLIGPDTEPLL